MPLMSTLIKTKHIYKVNLIYMFNVNDNGPEIVELDVLKYFINFVSLSRGNFRGDEPA